MLVFLLLYNVARVRARWRLQADAREPHGKFLNKKSKRRSFEASAASTECFIS
jgi:hypothetical protein